MEHNTSNAPAAALLLITSALLVPGCGDDAESGDTETGTDTSSGETLGLDSTSSSTDPTDATTGSGPSTGSSGALPVSSSSGATSGSSTDETTDGGESSSSTGNPDTSVTIIVTDVFGPIAGSLVSIASADGSFVASDTTSALGEVVIEDFPEGGSVTWAPTRDSQLSTILGASSGDTLYFGSSPEKESPGRWNHTRTPPALGETQFALVRCGLTGPGAGLLDPVPGRCLHDDDTIDWLDTALNALTPVGYAYGHNAAFAGGELQTSAAEWSTSFRELELVATSDAVEPHPTFLIARGLRRGRAGSGFGATVSPTSAADGSFSRVLEHEFFDYYHASAGSETSNQNMVRGIADLVPAGPTTVTFDVGMFLPEPDPVTVWDVDAGVYTFDPGTSGLCRDFAADAAVLRIDTQGPTVFRSWRLLGGAADTFVLPELDPNMHDWSPTEYSAVDATFQLLAFDTLSYPEIRQREDPFDLRVATFVSGEDTWSCSSDSDTINVLGNGVDD